MKRILLFFFMNVFFLSTLYVQAQEYLFFEDFSDGIPDDWTVIDQDMGTMDPGGAGAFLQQGDWHLINFNNVEDAPNLVVSSSYTEDIPADDWIILPGTEIPEQGYKLTWSAAALSPSESYEIIVSTVGGTIEDFTNPASEVIYSTNSEAASVEVNDVFTLNHDIEVNLNQFAGETIYIAYHYMASSWVLLIDNIGIEAPPAGVDLTITGNSVPIDYGWWALSQFEPMGPFNMTGLNFSEQALTNVEMTVHVESLDNGFTDYNAATTLEEIYNLDYTSVWSASSTIGDLEIEGEFDVSILEQFLPTDTGFYSLYYTLTSDQDPLDLNPDNNMSERYFFYVTENDHGRGADYLYNFAEFDVNEGQQIFFNGTDEIDGEGNTIDPSPVGEYGFVFDLITWVEMTDIGMFLQNPFGDIKAKLYQMNGNSVGDSIAATVVAPLGDTPEPTDFYILPFEEPLILGPGKYFCSVEDPDNGSANVLIVNYYPAPGNLNSQSSAAFANSDNGQWFSQNFVPIMEAFFTETETPEFASEIALTSAGDPDEFFAYSFTADPNGVYEGITWTVDGEDEGSGEEFSFVFPGVGDYEVCAVVELGDGTTIEECTTISLSLASEVSFETDPNSLEVIFTASANGLVGEYIWDFGEGSTGSGETITFVFEEEGNYEVCVTAILEDGSSLTDCQTITVGCALVAEIDELSSATASVTVSDGSEPYSFEWFDSNGDLLETTEEPFIETLSPGEDYSVIIIDASNCSRTVEFTTIDCNLEGIVPSIDYDFDANGYSVGFENSIDEFNLVGFFWEMVDANGNTTPMTIYNDANGGNGVPIIFGTQPGEYQAVVTDDSNCSTVVTFTVPELPDVGIALLDKLNSLSVSPNPANQFIRLDIDFKESVDLAYSLFDVAGRMMVEEQLNNALSFEKEIFVGNLANGYYVLAIEVEGELISQKILIQR